MRRLFVFTAGDKKARAHLHKSIGNSISSNLLDSHVSSEESKTIKSLLPDSSSFYAWGAVPGKQNIPMWESMTQGDFVLTVYDSEYHYISRVVTKLHNKNLAKAIWGTRDDGSTWEYIYILTKPEKVQVNIANKMVSRYLHDRYFGFTQISTERLQKINSDYESLESFLETCFKVRIQAAKNIAEEQLKIAEEQSKPFDPLNMVDGRKKIFAEIVRRRGQPKFRRTVLDAYSGICAVTGCDVEPVLEAAHITAYMGEETNHVTNGILLRADIHTLFDLGELRVDTSGVIHVSETLKNTIYEVYAGKQIRFPRDKAKSPNTEALSIKFSESQLS